MSVATLKKEIIRKIDNSSDKIILDIINKILDKTSFDFDIKKEMTIRALRSEEDIKKGRVYTKSQALKMLKSKK